LIMALLVASGCSTWTTITSSSGTQPTPVIEESTAAPQGKLAADALPCPQDAAGMQFVADEANGYCVLVPQAFSVERPNDSEMAFLGPVPESGTQAIGLIWVEDAGGKTAAEIVAPVIADSESLGLAVVQTQITLSGEQALVIDGLTGQDINRQVFVVHGGKLYKMMFVPDTDQDSNYETMQALYDAVIGSFAFLR
jgi:hypothetical protein